jgi:hypothetical protein
MKAESQFLYNFRRVFRERNVPEGLDGCLLDFGFLVGLVSKIDQKVNDLKIRQFFVLIVTNDIGEDEQL